MMARGDADADCLHCCGSSCDCEALSPHAIVVASTVDVVPMLRDQAYQSNKQQVS